MTRQYVRDPLSATELVCARCGLSKPISAFGVQRGRPRSWCKPCAAERTQEWRTANRDALLARRRAAYRATHTDTGADR